MAVPKPSIHGRDHRPGGADPIEALSRTVAVQNIGPLRFVAYVWGSDGSCQLPGDGSFYKVPWGSDGTGNVVTNDVSSLPGYGTAAGDTFPIIPGSRSSPPGTGLWTGDYFEEWGGAGVEFAGVGSVGDTAVAPRSRATPGLSGLYLTWVKVYVIGGGGNVVEAAMARHDADGLYHEYSGNQDVSAFTGLQIDDAYGRVLVSQDSGGPLAWQVQLWIVRLQPTFGTAFTVIDAS